MYHVVIKAHIDKIFRKLSRKNPKQMQIIYKKLAEVCKNPYRYKPLKKPLQSKRRVHIDSSFVIVYSVDEDNKTITVEEYDHHDNMYK
ncbi:MAG: type II toxin-antitoxin system mRNA interferase toxin, RelE/StbE family [Candidatus Hydrothermota bacterium]|nr:MAG: type II toxin-antitoxin system mRNA interferase toxin, RelE/StbE family [Candidatus Hydrothermae bacterium]